jgi:hypothetical protein
MTIELVSVWLWLCADVPLARSHVALVQENNSYIKYGDIEENLATFKFMEFRRRSNFPKKGLWDEIAIKANYTTVTTLVIF